MSTPVEWFWKDAEPVCLGIQQFVKANQTAAIATLLPAINAMLKNSQMGELVSIPEILTFEINSGEVHDIPSLTVFPVRTSFTEQFVNEVEVEVVEHQIICQVEFGDYDPVQSSRLTFAYCRLLYYMILVLGKGTGGRQRWKALSESVPGNRLFIRAVRPVDFNYFSPALTKAGGNARQTFASDPQLAIRVRCHSF